MEERKKTVGWQTWPNGKSTCYVYKGLSSVPSIGARWLTTTGNSSSRGSNDLSGFQGCVVCVCVLVSVYVYICYLGGTYIFQRFL